MFGANSFGWVTFAGFAATLGAKAATATGGAGSRWIRRRAPKLLSPAEARELVDESGILVSEVDLEAEEIDVLRLLGLL